jgi:hypothetical protein
MIIDYIYDVTGEETTLALRMRTTGLAWLEALYLHFFRKGIVGCYMGMCFAPSR